jgi:transposase
MLQPSSISEYRQALKASEAKGVRLEAENAQLKERVRNLEGQLEAAQRAAKRQAAPFSRGKRQPSGRPPGRRSGEQHGRHAHRQAPERVDEELFAELPEGCPDCGGELEEGEEGWEQYQEELPVVRALVIRVSGRWARCRSCGRRVRSRHPRQTSEAAAQVGPRALAFACSLYKEHGLSVRKTTATMRELGIMLSPGGLVQAMARIGDRCVPTYGALVEAVRQSAVVVGDETGWHVNGDSAWLWVMTTELVTVYGIREGRGFEEAASLLGADYGGVLVRDGWAVYRKFKEAEHQTCLAHLLRRCREMREVSWGRGREVPNLVSDILKDALMLRDRHQAGEASEGQLAVGVVELEARVGGLLARPAIAHLGNRRLLKHLGKEHWLGGGRWSSTANTGATPKTPMAGLSRMTGTAGGWWTRTESQSW